MTNVYAGGIPVNNAMSVVENETVIGNNTFSGNNTFTGSNVFSNTNSFQTVKTGQPTTTIAVDTTLAATDCGVVQVVTVDAKVVTLPATVVGLSFTIMNGGADGAILVKVSPNSADKISGNGFSAADNKAAQNTKATARKGDYIRLIGDGDLGWYITEVVGVWARES